VLYKVLRGGVWKVGEVEHVYWCKLRVLCTEGKEVVVGLWLGRFDVGKVILGVQAAVPRGETCACKRKGNANQCSEVAKVVEIAKNPLRLHSGYNGETCWPGPCCKYPATA
jgi:hypothetical protein